MFRRLPLITCFIATSAMAQSTQPDSTLGNPPKAGEGVDSKVITPEERASARAYWTPERMQNAKRLPLIQLEPKKGEADKPK